MQDDTMQTAFNFNDLPEKQTPLSKRALNCKKAREKRSEYAAMREELEYLRQLLRHRTVSELYSTSNDGLKKVNLQ